MIKNYSFIIKSKIDNTQKIEGESATDKSNYRPDIANLRDKAIKGGNANVGLYDYDGKGKEPNRETAKAMAFVRSKKRDITEIQRAEEMLKTTLENGAKNQSEYEKAVSESKKLSANIEKIAENTTAETTKQE